ncbi:VOC family protein [Brachybacterium sp. AOP42-C2-15]|uniref:VOC family protein n=1 Tax=unclassified Brachybacterium TaxID=2623841 RepID=UPI003F92139B
MTTVSTCLWFDGDIDEAAEFYVSLLPGSKLLGRSVYEAGGGPPDGPDMTGQALTVEIELMGVPYMLLNGGPQFPLSEAVSIVVTVDSQAEIDRLWEALVAAAGASRNAGGASTGSGCPGRSCRSSSPPCSPGPTPRR